MGKLILKQWRIPEKLAKSIEEEAAQRGISETEYIRRVLEENLSKIRGMKEILTEFPGRCRKCKKKIEVGTRVRWSPVAGIMCLDCYTLGDLSNKTLVKLHQKERRRKRLLKAYDEEIDEKAEKYEMLNFYELLEKNFNKTKEMSKILKDYFNKLGSTLPKEEQELLKKVDKVTDEHIELDQKIRQFLLEKRMMKKKKKRKSYVQ